MDNENNKANREMPENDQATEKLTSSEALNEDRRFKVLSPSMLVFKRFIRNRLGITGVIFITIMFLFSFVGGWLISYGETEKFHRETTLNKEFGGVSFNKDYILSMADGTAAPSMLKAALISAITDNKNTFTLGTSEYHVNKTNDTLYYLSALEQIALAEELGGSYHVSYTEQTPGTGFEEAFLEAIANKAESFTFGGQQYMVIAQRKNYRACQPKTLALATVNVYDFASPDKDLGFAFRSAVEQTLLSLQGDTADFALENRQFTLSRQEGYFAIQLKENGSLADYATVSRYIVRPLYEDVFFSLDYKEMARKTILEKKTTFQRTENGEQVTYTLEALNGKDQQWAIRKPTVSKILDSYAFPSAEHISGTDVNGMDLFTRLMYGGRISLIIGFIVVIIETLIGVVLGGLAGYFGKWVDNLIMRLVDIFNSIPSLALIIILGSMMDAMHVDPFQRLMFLMVILGLFGWPGIARMVRGQILSLREQEFMVATEATGLSVTRRIFRHLVPNVIPQLIVICTMSLGDIILTESVLSFLGLGVKAPFASWGNIINDVNNATVLTNYLFVWIPAGFCILITVLGFNFIGDGLRDAFDPKMKR